MLFRNVALVSLALVAAASAADTNPTSDHGASLRGLSQRRLPKEKKEKKQKEEKEEKPEKVKEESGGDATQSLIDHLEKKVLGQAGQGIISPSITTGDNEEKPPGTIIIAEVNRGEGECADPKVLSLVTGESVVNTNKRCDVDCDCEDGCWYVSSADHGL
jgi:hypothetical protein